MPYIHNLSPFIFEWGFIKIGWYGLFYVLGFIFAYFWLLYMARIGRIKLSRQDIEEFIMYLLFGVVIFARLFYTFVYYPQIYLKNPLMIFAVWHGGLSFHGGLIGAVIAGLIFTKKKKLDFYNFADILVVPAALGLVFGRLANFINGELAGRVTDVSWCMYFKNYEGCRHPSQLYESFKNLVIFITLFFLSSKKLAKGFLFWFFIIMYSVLRFFIEFYRTPDEQLGFIVWGLTMGQVLNIIMFGIALFFILRLKK